MKEFVEKLIGRFEEEKEFYRKIRKNTHCRRTEMDDCDSCRADHYLNARLNCVDNLISIVNQLAEEYGKDTNVTTNADFIRKMNDEELAEFLINFKNTFGEEHEGQQSCVDWLQSEVKGSDV